VKKLMCTALFVLVVVLAACGSADMAVAPLEELSLTATDLAYDKNHLEVTAGQTVKVTLHNAGVLEHDFSIMEIPHNGEVNAEGMHDETGGHEMSVDPEVHVAAPIGESLSVEFTPTAPGEYEYFCTVAGHKEGGMVGTLVVRAE